MFEDSLCVRAILYIIVVTGGRFLCLSYTAAHLVSSFVTISTLKRALCYL